ncbi:MAG: type II secretion system F family protein [Candidatus Micrarchaeota archaeon]
MQKAKIPLLLFPTPKTERLLKRMGKFGLVLLPAFPALPQTLSKIRLDVRPEIYLVASLLSSFTYGLLFFIFSLALITLTAMQGEPLIPSLLIGISLWLLFFMLHLFYPAIIMKKIAAKENKDLLFALREIIIDVDGGVPLFDSLKNVSHAGYGYVSDDLEWVVRQVDSGIPEREALKQLALRTESEFLKRAAWQMVNALESGARMGDALESIASAVEDFLFREIKNYSSNLNFLLLLYMLGGVVAPSLGITFMILLSAFSGLGVTLENVTVLLLLSSTLQVMMIGYMASMRPELFGG